MLQIESKNLGTATVLSLQGQIVNGETEVLRNAVHSLSRVSAVKLDLARVTTIDAGGLGLMLELREELASKEVRFELMNATRLVRKVFVLARLDSVFQITSGVEFVPAFSQRARSSAPALASCA
jgi:anti-anti-sigma factor